MQNVYLGYPYGWTGGKRRSRPGSAICPPKMDENALTAGEKMLTEMEKLHEVLKAVKLVMGRSSGDAGNHIHRWPDC